MKYAVIMRPNQPVASFVAVLNFRSYYFFDTNFGYKELNFVQKN
jgi:hypothetical protein